MGNADLIGTLTETVKELSEPFLLKRLFHQHKDGTPLPSGAVLQEIVELLRAIIFPEYYGKSLVNINTVKFYIGANIERYIVCFLIRYRQDYALLVRKKTKK